MITITFKGRDTGFRVEGHAGYDVRGRDVVCSAISAMAQQTVIGLEYCAYVKVKEGEGFLDVRLNIDNVRSSVLIYAFEEAVKRVAMQYPEYVTIKEERHVSS